MGRISTYLNSMLFFFFLVTPSLAQSRGDIDSWGSPMWGWGHMMFGGVMMIVFWGGIILLVVLLVRSFGSSKLGDFNASTPATPLDILKERFAKGEIDKTEYDERRKILSD